jgi:YhgE/Pip-like protein
VEEQEPTPERLALPTVPQTRASGALATRAVWAVPVIFGTVLILMITTFYIGSVVNPAGHLHGMPVSIVNEDTGASVGGQQINFGDRLQAGLLSSRSLSRLLSLKPVTLARAQARMDTGKDFATIVIPRDFTAWLRDLSGGRSSTVIPPGGVDVELLTNPREGTEGASLATAVIEPAIAAASNEFGQELHKTNPAPSADANPAAQALISKPFTFSVVPYRPLPSHSALGLSAFYVALLTMMCGFLGAIVVNSGVDGALGYATIDIGPRWRQLRPLAISRWDTLLTKWVVGLVVSGLLSALMLAMAAGVLGMNAPDVGYLWLYCWLAAATITAGTLVLLAILGTPGQLIAMLLFVYLGLASAGGTVPVQALPGVLKLISNIDPLRQILSVARSILYFNARGDAGLTHGLLATVIGLIFWLGVGAAVVRWYDRKGMFRMDPEMLAYVHQSAGAYRAKEPAAPGSGAGAQS